MLLLLAGCQRPLPPFATVNMEGQQCMIVKTDDPYLSEEANPFGVENRYKLMWPAKGMMTPEAEKELIRQVFGDSTATSATEAAQRWLNNLWLYDDVKAVKTQRVNSIGEKYMLTLAELSNSIEENGELVTFVTGNQTCLAGAAHGIYLLQYLTYDRKTQRVVHLNDLVDTAMLGEVIVRAVNDLVVNKDVLDCMFDEYKTADRIAVPDNFIIDSTRSTITLVFQQYDIAPYACGLPSVVLPVFWLSKHLELTPYAKKLFGKGSYLE